jgi:hypothetical protein
VGSRYLSVWTRFWVEEGGEHGCFLQQTYSRQPKLTASSSRPSFRMVCDREILMEEGNVVSLTAPITVRAFTTTSNPPIVVYSRHQPTSIGTDVLRQRLRPWVLLNSWALTALTGVACGVRMRSAVVDNLWRPGVDLWRHPWSIL